MNSVENREHLKEEQTIDDLALIFSPDEERFERLRTLACKFFNVPVARISLTGKAYKWFPPRAGQESPADFQKNALFCSHTIHSEDTLIIPDTQKDTLHRNDLPVSDSDVRFYAGHPVRFDGKILGTFCIMDSEPRKMNETEVDILKSLAVLVEDEIRISMMHATQEELIRELDEARQQALIDPLTKTWNRRGAEQLLPQELDRSIRSSSQITIMMIDIDRFKEINDSYGHPFGDKIIRTVSEIIRCSIRPHDIFIRYGGDEFLLFFGNTSEETADFLSRRILSRIKNTPVIHNEIQAAISISIGIATADAEKDTDLDTLISMADSALYSAKGSGRCCAKKAVV